MYIPEEEFKVSANNELTLQLARHQKKSLCAHLFDVPHLIPQVTGRPVSCHHFLLEVGACAVHHTINSGPVLSELFPTDAIGHRLLGGTEPQGSDFSLWMCLKGESATIVFTGVKTNVTAVYVCLLEHQDFCCYGYRYIFVVFYHCY